MGRRGKFGIGASCVHKLTGHEAAVTCVRYGKLEIMSGDSLGRIFMWWMDGRGHGEESRGGSGGGHGKPYILHKISVHYGPVKCLQFDALYIVSGGADGTLCITDIATGDVMQTIRAHTDILTEDIDEEKDINNQNNRFASNDGFNSTINSNKNAIKNPLKKAAKRVLAVAFDSHRIISAGTDNTLRYFPYFRWFLFLLFSYFIIILI